MFSESLGSRLLGYLMWIAVFAAGSVHLALGIGLFLILLFHEPIKGAIERLRRASAEPRALAEGAAREPYVDPIDRRIDELAGAHVDVAERLRTVRERASNFFLDTDVWLAADAIWTIVQAAWPEDQADAFFAARDDAERRLGEGDADLRSAADAVVKEISEQASTAIQSSAMISSSHLDFDEQNRAADRAMWQAGGAHHVVRAAVLAYVLGEQLDEAATGLLTLPWLALCDTSEEDRYDLIAAAEENTFEAFRALADDRVLFREPDQTGTALVQLLAPLEDGPAADEGGESADDDASYDDEEMESLFGER